MNPFIVIAILGWALWSFGTKVATNHLHPFLLQAINYGIGFLAVPFLIFALAKVPNPQFDRVGILWAIGSALFGIIAYVSFGFALKNGSAGTVVVLSTTYPVLTFILSVLFLGEQITLAKTGGILMVLAGVIILGR